MTNPYRALCAELLQELCCFYKPWDLKEERYSDAMKRARTLLAQPVAEGPTDDEMTQLLFEGFRGPIEFICDAEEEAHLMIRSHVKFARAVLDRWGHRPAPPAEGEVAELVEWLQRRAAEVQAKNCTTIYSAYCLTRAADLLEQLSAPAPVAAPVPLIELPQGWHMLCDIEPEPGTKCDWVILAPWGCDHGSGEWRDYNGVSPCDFFDVPVGWPVRYKGFASADGVMVSDPKLTAWRARPLPTTESQP